jgi:hypothetical protein
MLSVISSSNSNGCTHQSYLITTVVYEADLSWPFLLSPHPNKKKKKRRPKHPTPQHKLRNLVCNIKSNRYTIGLSDNYQIPFCSPNSDHAKFFTNGNHKSIFFFFFLFSFTCSYGMKTWCDRFHQFLQFKEWLHWELSVPWNSEQKAVTLGIVWLASLNYF